MEGIATETMNTDCLEHRLTEHERDEFEKNGYFVLEDALSEEHVQDLTQAADQVAEEFRQEKGFGPNEPVNPLDFIGKDYRFLELLDWPKTFPKVWGILGWNIQLYHSHLTVTPPRDPETNTPTGRYGWHQDSGQLNRDLETHQRPRISLKVAYFLTDNSEPKRANFYCIPGSQLSSELDRPSVPSQLPDGAIPLLVKAGSALFFDRRLWHGPSPNYSSFPRKVLFYGYSYRWLRPRDDMSVSHYLERCDPIRKQLLGVSTGGYGYTSPNDEDVPLRVWLSENTATSVT